MATDPAWVFDNHETAAELIDKLEAELRKAEDDNERLREAHDKEWRRAGIAEENNRAMIASIASLADPEVVLVNMMRGTIAIPSVRALSKLFGDVINDEDARLLQIAHLREELEICQRALDKFRSQSHGIKALAEIERLRAALDHIGGLSRALRVSGPDLMDLQGLSDALTEAVDTAHGALSGN